MLSQEQIVILKRLPPQWAVKPNNDPRRKGMSVITPQYVIDTLNDAFGIGNWTLVHEVVFMDVKWTVVKGKLNIKVNDKEFSTPETYGGNDNTDIGDRMKGAVTDLLTKSGQFLGIAHSVFKGEWVGGEHTSKLDEAVQLAKQTFPKSEEVIVKSMWTNEQKNIFYFYEQMHANSPEVMIAFCEKNNLTPPADYTQKSIRQWNKENCKILFEKYEEVKQ